MITPLMSFIAGDGSVSEDEAEQAAAGAWPHKREEEADKLLRLWGPPGVGKAALVRGVDDSDDDDGSSGGGFIWGPGAAAPPTNTAGPALGFVRQTWTDMPNPFVDADDLAHHILSELTNNTWKRRDGLVTTCKFVLGDSTAGRTLLVFNGVRSMEDWDRINAGLTCVVVITEEESVAIHVAHTWEDRVLRIDPVAAAEELCWRRGGSLPPLLLLPARADCRARRCKPPARAMKVSSLQHLAPRSCRR
ncbi:hypothetical protein HU200_028715 [Digitaria exilis]|uniref:Uncharacterized protein n=1 Tax=Digitaria exilis TaxID=1010633 RepID=A0A835EVR9_9POAL|nr:hypothetical protein HU200_028715 [Digitaria exilis]